MNPTILVTGATGNVGSEVVKALAGKGLEVSIALPASELGKAETRFGVTVSYRVLDFEDSSTFPAAFEGIKKVFLVRPPHLADAKKYFAPFVEAARRAGIEHIVFLSLIGVEKNRVVPHYKIEQIILASGLHWTFLRCSFFMQNLNTTHLKEIKEHNDIFVPAGKGKTSFIDVRDIAAVAAMALSEEGHEDKVYILTGGEALDYRQVAREFSEGLGRKVRYSAPSALSFLFRKWRSRTPFKFAIVMVGIYTTARFGLAGKVTGDVQRLLGRNPITLRQYIQDYRQSWV